VKIRCSLCCFALLLAASACGESRRYKLIDVPYCDVGPGVARSAFKGRYTLLHRHGNEVGTEDFTGDRPEIQAALSSEAVYALVSCSGPSPVRDIASMTKALDALDEKDVPTVCPGQTTVFHQVLKAEPPDAAAKAAGFSGVIRFPKVALACEQGVFTIK
jgi:hypothetical protein